MMSRTNDKLIDVLIVGAGPAGLMMACQLALHNITFRIIDKKSSPAIHSGALIIHACTMEIFQQMGIAEKVLETGIIVNYLTMQFNNRKSYSLDVTGLGESLTQFPYLLLIEQWQTENILQQFLKDHGHCIENEKSLIDFSQDDDIITSEICKSDGSTEIIKSKFLIGADGNDSFVRKHLQILFPGKTQDSRLFITDCDVKLPFSDREILFSFTKTVTSGFFPLKGTRRRIDGLIPFIQQNEVNFNDVADFLKVQGGITMNNPTWFSVFHSHSRCAKQFCIKRYFLIGDAAHVHSPVGAQGMNAGIHDAYNLAWKLAYFINGKASEKLLKTYQMERKPVAINIIHYTDQTYSFLTRNNIITMFSRLHLFPLILPLLLTWLKYNEAMRNQIFSAISGIGIKYKVSNLSVSVAREDFIKYAPKPGDRLPYITYDTRNGHFSLHSDLTSTHFCLYIFGRDTPPPAFQNVLKNYKDIINVRCIDRESGTQLVYDKLGIKDEGFYLIRPDLYIAYRSSELNAEILHDYLQKVLI